MLKIIVFIDVSGSTLHLPATSGGWVEPWGDEGADESAAGAAVTHHAVAQDMTLTLGVVIFHFHRDNFANIGNFAHGYNFGDVQVH